MAELVFLSYVDNTYLWHCVHNGHDKPDFFLTCLVHCTLVLITQHAGLFFRKRLLRLSIPFSETLTRCFCIPVPRSRWHTFTQAASYTLLLVCVVITSRQLHVVCIACFNSTTYEMLFFASYVTDIHSFAALALRWMSLFISRYKSRREKSQDLILRWNCLLQ